MTKPLWIIWDYQNVWLATSVFFFVFALRILRAYFIKFNMFRSFTLILNKKKISSYYCIVFFSHFRAQGFGRVPQIDVFRDELSVYEFVLVSTLCIFDLCTNCSFHDLLVLLFTYNCL